MMGVSSKRNLRQSIYQELPHPESKASQNEDSNFHSVVGSTKVRKPIKKMLLTTQQSPTGKQLHILKQIQQTQPMKLPQGIQSVAGKFNL